MIDNDNIQPRRIILWKMYTDIWNEYIDNFAPSLVIKGFSRYVDNKGNRTDK